MDTIKAKCINKVKEIDVATVAGNKTMTAAMDRRAVERCKEAIEKIGVVHTPIVGATKDGNRLLLSGQCELTALRELGIKKMDAIEIGEVGDGGAKAKMSLLLISLREKPGALCEGLLLQEAVSTGVSRLEIQDMLGKSASWVSNRLSLVTRLDSNVFEMVKSGLLEPRSAEEVARLPADAQFTFAEGAVREGLPKSAIELLVAGYNDAGCPDAVKAQILSGPREALKRMSDRRRAVNTGNMPPDPHQKNMQLQEDLDGCIKAANLHMAAICRILFNESPYTVNSYRPALKELETNLSALITIVRRIIYPGKMEVEQSAG